MRAAVGSGEPDKPLDGQAFPVLSFLLLGDADLQVGYFLTPGRLVVLEQTSEARRIVAMPLTRVRRTVELVADQQLLVEIEVESGAVTLGEAEPGVTRMAPLVYSLSAPLSDAAGAARLGQFAITLRAVLGV